MGVAFRYPLRPGLVTAQSSRWKALDADRAMSAVTVRLSGLNDLAHLVVVEHQGGLESA